MPKHEFYDYNMLQPNVHNEFYSHVQTLVGAIYVIMVIKMTMIIRLIVIWKIMIHVFLTN
jgi:hypothetical protein